MSIPSEEQETVISYMRNDTGANIYTSDRTVITKLDHMCEVSPEFYRFIRAETIGGEVIAKEYELVNKSLLSLRAKKRVMTEEQKQAAAERMAQMHKDGVFRS